MDPKISVIMPCLNEEAVVAQCIRWAQEGFAALGVTGEVVIVDNGSTDRSVERAQAAGARVIHEKRPGYGSALLTGFEHARGDMCIMGDADGTYDYREIPALVKPLEEGAQLVLGSRLGGMIESGAMPWLHRYFGNPLLTRFLNFLFGLQFTDCYSGMRAIRKADYDRLRLRMDGMEYALEMLVAARHHGLRVAETPIQYHARVGDSKLNTWRDGWRSLRFMLLYSPTYLFLIPGAVIGAVGFTALLALLPGPIIIGTRHIDMHVMVLGSLMGLLGTQVVLMGLCARAYAYVEGLAVSDRLIEWIFKHMNLERGLMLGTCIFAVGLLSNARILWQWVQSGFGNLDEVRLALAASTCMILGVQISFAAFLVNLMTLRRRA